MGGLGADSPYLRHLQPKRHPDKARRGMPKSISDSSLLPAKDPEQALKTFSTPSLIKESINGCLLFSIMNLAKLAR